jgi:hypothetical protein
MRRLCGAAVGLLLLTGCSRDLPTWTVETEESFPGPSPVVTAGDLRLAPQLLRGWHEVEHGSWRWTERQFSVALPAPRDRPVSLRLEFSLAEAILARLGPITLRAAVNGAPLAASSYSNPGQHVYRRPIPAGTFREETVQVDFVLDKALPPGTLDRRELGIVVASVGFYE